MRARRKGAGRVGGLRGNALTPALSRGEREGAGNRPCVRAPDPFRRVNR